MRDFLTSSTAPWWTTLLGVVIGGLISFAVSRTNDKSRAKREREERWTSQVQTFCADLVAAAHELSSAVSKARHEWAVLVDLHPEHQGDDEGEAEYIQKQKFSYDLQVRTVASLIARLKILDAGEIATKGDALLERLSDPKVYGPYVDFEKWRVDVAANLAQFIEEAQKLAQRPTS